MKTTSKFLIFFALLFCSLTVYCQCETYLQKAESLKADGRCVEAKKWYEAYKVCNPNATGIDAKIAECDRLLKEKDTESNNNGVGYHYETRTNSTNTQSSSNNNSQSTQFQPPKRTKTAIGIRTFTGDYSKSAIAQ